LLNSLFFKNTILDKELAECKLQISQLSNDLTQRTNELEEVTKKCLKKDEDLVFKDN